VLTTGNVGVTATTGSILDGGDQHVDVKASGLRLWAGVGAGASTNALETQVGTLSARAAGGGVFVLEQDAVTVGDVSVQASRVAANGASSSTPASGDATQSDLRTTSGGGSIVLRTADGSITLANGTAPGQPGDSASVSADGAGTVLIEAQGENADVMVAADIASGSGDVSVIASGGVSFTGTADIRSGGTGTIDVQATGGSIGMADGSLFDAGSGDVRLLALGDVTLGGVLTTGNVGVTATTGSILDGGDQHVDLRASGLRLWAGVGAGASTNALETQVGTLSARAAGGGVFVLEQDAVTVGDVSVQASRVAANGASSSTPASGDATQSDLRTTAGGSIVLRTVDGSITISKGTVLGVPDDGASVRADGAGTVLIQAQGDGAAVTTAGDVVSGSGDVSVKADAEVTFSGTGQIRSGNFVADVPQSFTAPLKVQTSSVDVTATLTGATFQVTPPVRDVQDPNAKMLPLVIGTPVKVLEQPPSEGIFVDRDEVANLRFNEIVFGGAEPGQEVWIQTDPAQSDDRLVFFGKLKVESPFGKTRLAGRIEGFGMEIQGAGETTYLDGADVLHSRNVTIADALVVREDSIIEVADADPATTLVLTIQGDITVQAGTTLKLLADEIRFDHHSTKTSAIIRLEAGATLVIGATTIFVDEAVTFDSEGGHVQLRGAPSAIEAPEVGATGPEWAPLPDFVASDFAWTALDAQVAWLAADTDPDGGLASLTIGADESRTSVVTPTPWTVLQASGSQVQIQMRGTATDLGVAGGAAWSFDEETALRAATGNLNVHVDLAGAAGLSLTAQQGALVMDASVVIHATGAVALAAPLGVTVSRVTSYDRIDAHSAGGIVQATGAVTGGVHLDAPSVSVHGIGLQLPVLDAAKVPVAQAYRVQVSGVRGMTFEGRGADGGVIYRTMNRGVAFEQLRMADDDAARVLVARSDLLGSATRIGQGESVSSVFDRPLGASSTPFAPLAVGGAGAGSAVSSYLGTAGRASALSWDRWPTLGSDRSSLDLNDLSYGIDEGSQGRSVFSGDPGSPLLLSSGQVAVEPIWTIETNLFS
jgi:hypothetical protein